MHKNSGRQIHSCRQKIIHPLSFRCNLIIKEGPIDYTLDVDFVTDGPGGFIKLVNEIFKVHSIFSLKENRLQSPELLTKLGLHCGQSSCGSLADSMANNLPGMIGDVL
jgi:hypothetical protein